MLRKATVPIVLILGALLATAAGSVAEETARRGPARNEPSRRNPASARQNTGGDANADRPHRGSETPAAQDAPEDTLKVYHLNEADCKSVSEAIHQLQMSAMVVADPSTQSLIVRTDRDGHQQVRKLLTELDVPPRDRKEQPEFLPLIHRDAKEVATLISQIVTSRRTRIAFDVANQMVILSGGVSDIAAAQDLVSRIDHPQRVLTLSFFFVQGTVGTGSPATAAATLPASLRDVAPVLERNGFANITLLAPITTSVQESSEFSTAGMLEMADGLPLHFDIGGDVHETATSKNARFTLRAQVIRGRGDAAARVFSVETTLTAKLGDYVVLAAAPSQSGDNTAIALIARAD